MPLTVEIKHQASLCEFTKRYQSFRFLNQQRLKREPSIQWKINGNNAYDIQVMLIGKTGYGKSTTINKMVGVDCFDTDDISACTKQIYSVEYEIEANPYCRDNEDKFYFSINDLPGIGESIVADRQYSKWYQGMISRSSCILYVLRADQRDYSLDLDIFKSLICQNIIRQKTIIGINFADRIEPISENGDLSKRQKENISEKRQLLSTLFKIPVEQVIHYSARTGENFGALMRKIAYIVQENV